MNGLEAIKVMMEGKIVKRTDMDIKYRVNNDRVEGMNHSDMWCEEFLFNINGEFEEYIAPKPLTGWERVNEGAETYFISVFQGVDSEFDWHDEIDTRCFGEANYFSTKEKAEEIAFKQTLFRKLQRFSDENGGNEIDWSCPYSKMSFIAYKDGKLFYDWMTETKYFGQVYFASREVVRNAIELFHDDLIKYFTM